MTNVDEFDLGAAWMRQAQGDFKAFLEAFTTRMEGAFPNHVRAERRRDSLLSSTRHVRSLAIDAGSFVYRLEVAGPRLLATRQQTVRGVTLQSVEMPVPDWLAALNKDIQALAEQTGLTHTALHNFLMS